MKIGIVEDTLYRIEPTWLDPPGDEVTDLVAEVSAAAAKLDSAVPAHTASSLADIVRPMNCYYSNLIEGHNTLPRDIARALEGNLAEAEERRNLQLEAKAHIYVQREIDRRFAAGNVIEPGSIEFVTWLHREFYRDAPDAYLQLGEAPDDYRMEPGQFRSRASQDVTVGRHHPPASERVAALMTRFAERYRFESAGKAKRVLFFAIAHHRFNFIHPFPDGNGRVSRLMSHTMALGAGIGAHGLWSISRGLARGLESRDEYKRMMDHADMPRQGELDGRGNLSERALREFTAWFLRVALDQIVFMTTLFQLDALADRLETWVVERSGLRDEAAAILVHTLTRGSMARGEASRVTGLGERAARDTLASLVQAGLLASDTPKGPVFLKIPLEHVEALFPQLYPRV